MFKALIGWCLERKFDYHDRRLNSACKIYYDPKSEYSGEEVMKARQRKEYHIGRLKGLAKKLDKYNEREIVEFEKDVRNFVKSKWKKYWGKN